MRGDWGLFKRKRKNGPVWYYWYYDEKGRRQQRSTGKELKKDAISFVKDLFHEQSTNPEILLRNYAEDFFDLKKSKWVQRRNARGYKVTEPMAAMRAGHLQNHIIPEFGHKRVKDIRAAAVEDWILALDAAAATKNHILGTFRHIMNEAKRDGIIQRNPIDDVDPVSRSTYNQSDSLSIKELKKLFPKNMEKLRMIWRRDDLIVAYFLMVSSGIRSGELRGLTWQNVLWDKSAILITQAVKADRSIGLPKTNEVRGIIIPRRAIDLLRWWQGKTAYSAPSDFVFPGEHGNAPIDRNLLSREFRKALERAKIKTDGRNLRAHSLRHTYNTIMKGVLTSELLREFTGHRTEQMTQRYDHPHLIDRLQQFEDSKKSIEKTWNF